MVNMLISQQSETTPSVLEVIEHAVGVPCRQPRLPMELLNRSFVYELKTPQLCQLPVQHASPTLLEKKRVTTPDCCLPL
jgi:hypothetical protein